MRGSIPALEMGLTDVSDDYQPFLNAMFNMV